MEIEARGISVTLGGKKVLSDITMNAADRRFVGIIGPNGSGKSTLLKCMYRILRADCGAVFIDSRELDSFSYKESAKKLSVVAQHNYYNFDFTVREVVLMGRAPHKKQMERDNEKDYEIVNDSLKKVEMEDYAERIFSTLSGGEQQRIILARALAQQTECLILDEPTNHLDVKYQLQILDLVKSLDLTVVAALHDLNIAAMYCDFIYVLKEGEIRKSGVPKEIFTKDTLKEIYEIDALIAENPDSGLVSIIYQPSVKGAV